MRHLFFQIIVCLLLFSESISQSGINISYSEVVNKLYSTYNFELLSQTHFISIEKKADGYHVATYPYENYKQSDKDFLFWSAAQQQFLVIEFQHGDKESTEENKTTVDGLLNTIDTLYFNHFPVYGYRGWHIDAISLLENKTNLNDTLTYCLGRAYSEYASNLVNDNSGRTVDSLIFIMKEPPDALNDEQLKTYRHFRNLAIDCFYKTYLLNKNFETLVGNIYTKYCNEHLVKFLELVVIQSEKEAIKELPPNLYTPFTISMAKNYLTSCDSNALLFTNGDNDTYPLLYVQAMMHYRTDVFVLNLSLLNTGEYINFARRGCFDASPIQLSLNKDDYKDNVNDYVLLLSDNSSDTFDISNLQSFITSDNNNQTEPKKIHTDNFIYKFINDASVEKIRKQCYIDDIKYSPPFMWKIYRQYLLKSDLVIFDAIAQNNWQRPMYFASTVSGDNLLGLNEYLIHSGIAYCITPFKKNVSETYYGNISSALQYDMLMKKFDWSGLDKVISSEFLLCTNYKLQFSNLATQLAEENKNKKSIEVADRCLQLFPDSNFPFDYSLLALTEVYLQSKEKDKASSIINSIVFNIKKNRSVFNNVTFYNKSIKQDAEVLEYLKQLVEKYKLKELENLFDK